MKIDSEGICTYINEYGINFFNYGEEEITGKPLTDTIVPLFESTGRNLKELIKLICTDPDEYSININENIKKNGDRVWIEWHNKAILDKNNKRSGHIAIGVDITTRKKAEDDLIESEVKLWSVLNATQESIYLIDLDGVITMTNSTGIKRLNKISEDEIIGHHFWEFLPPSVARIRMAKLEEVISKGKPVKFEDEFKGRFFAHNFFPLYSGIKMFHQS